MEKILKYCPARLRLYNPCRIYDVLEKGVKTKNGISLETFFLSQVGSLAQTFEFIGDKSHLALKSMPHQ